MKKTYHGCCHCGAIRFEADIDLDEGIRKCNCSFCWKLGYRKSFTAYEALRVTEGRDSMRDYQAVPVELAGRQHQPLHVPALRRAHLLARLPRADGRQFLGGECRLPRRRDRGGTRRRACRLRGRQARPANGGAGDHRLPVAAKASFRSTKPAAMTRRVGNPTKKETVMQHQIVSREEWLEARTALLAREKAFTKPRDELGAERRALPWVKIEKPYVFDGPAGKVTLAELFDGRSQLFVKHFMMGPGQTAALRRLLVRGGSLEGILDPSPEQRRQPTSPSRARRSPRSRCCGSDGLARSVRVGVRQRLQLRLQRILHARADGGEKGAFYNFTGTTPGSRICRATACSTRNEAGKSSTPIRRSDAATSSSSASTASRRDAQGPQREGRTTAARLGAAARHLRQGRDGRADRALPRRRLRLRRARPSNDGGCAELIDPARMPKRSRGLRAA